MGRGEVRGEFGGWGEGMPEEDGEVHGVHVQGHARAAHAQWVGGPVAFAYAWFGASLVLGAAVGGAVVRGGAAGVGRRVTYVGAVALGAGLLALAHAGGQRAMPEGMMQRLKQRRAVAEFATRTMSVVHSTAASVWAAKVLWGEGQPDLFAGPLHEAWSPMIRRALEASVAYMSVDLCMSLRQAWESRDAAAGRLRVAEDIAHHVVTIVAQTWALGHACYGAFVALLLLTEVTTPLLNLRWFLSQAKAPPAQLLAVSLILMLGFFVFRVLNYSYMAWLITTRSHELGEPVGAALLVVTFLLMAGLNFYWMGIMVRRAREMRCETSSAITH